MGKQVKRKLLLLLGLFVLSGAAYSEEDTFAGGVFIQYESMENGVGRSIGAYAEAVDFNVIYMGVSLNYISSSDPIQFARRTEIAPIYLFVGVQGPWKITPYFEAGVDLVDSFWDELGRSDDEEETGADVDYFVAAGIKVAIDERYEAALYAKEYVFKFKENINAPLERVSPVAYGMRLTMRF